MLVTPYFVGRLVHNAVGFKVEIITVGFLKRKDSRSNCANCIKGFVQACAIMIKDSVQILTVDTYCGNIVVS